MEKPCFTAVKERQRRRKQNLGIQSQKYMLWSYQLELFKISFKKGTRLEPEVRFRAYACAHSFYFYLQRANLFCLQRADLFCLQFEDLFCLQRAGIFCLKRADLFCLLCADLFCL